MSDRPQKSREVLGAASVWLTVREAHPPRPQHEVTKAEHDLVQAIKEWRRST